MIHKRIVYSTRVLNIFQSEIMSTFIFTRVSHYKFVRSPYEKIITDGGECGKAPKTELAITRLSFVF